jgi:cation:H+ antiporter
MAGLLFRPTRRIGRMGTDSLVVILLYAAALAGLFAIARSG